MYNNVIFYELIINKQTPRINKAVA